MHQLDQHDTLSEQDYGPWLDRATLYEHDGRFLLKIEGGYSQPYETAWYELHDRPRQSLAECLTGELWADPTGNQEQFLGEELGVSVVKLDYDPEED